MAAIGLALMRPELTWQDWRREYDPLRGACRWIAERYGEDAEVWINGDDACAEAAAAYLDNLLDWRTGERAKLHRYTAARPRRLAVFELPFQTCAERILRARPEQEGFLVLASMEWWCGLTQEDLDREGVSVVYARPEVLDHEVTFGELVLIVKREKAEDRGAFWMRRGGQKFAKGDRNGATEAWKRAVGEDGKQWVTMNNLAWMMLEEGRVEEARAWIDRALEYEEARANAEVRDTAEAVSRAEENAVRSIEFRGRAGE